MTARTTTACDHCGKEQTDAQYLEVKTRGCRIVGAAHLCDFECMARWADRARLTDPIGHLNAVAEEIPHPPRTKT